MFTLSKLGVIDKVTVDLPPKSRTIIERFIETGWKEAVVEREGARAHEATRLVNRCCEQYQYPVYAKTIDSKMVSERMD